MSNIGVLVYLEVEGGGEGGEGAEHRVEDRAERPYGLGVSSQINETPFVWEKLLFSFAGNEFSGTNTSYL